MANRSDDKKKVRCSFCNKSQEQVRKLIAGPNVYICDECIEICSEIIQDEFDNEPSDSEINLLTGSKHHCWWFAATGFSSRPDGGRVG